MDETIATVAYTGTIDPNVTPYSMQISFGDRAGRTGIVVNWSCLARDLASGGRCQASSGSYTVPIFVHPQINSVGDGRDADLSDGYCDTGATNSDGEPECTIRAAIEQHNANPYPDTRFVVGSGMLFRIPGSDIPVIRPYSELPSIEHSVSIDGTSQPGFSQVIIEGTQAGTANGISLAGGENRISGLAIRNFKQNGVRSTSSASLTLSAMEISGNCGWGVEAWGELYVTDQGNINSINRNPDSRIGPNGFGLGCSGGGVIKYGQENLSLSNVEISGNNGAGVLSEGGDVFLYGVLITGNFGQGLTTAEWNGSGSVYVGGNLSRIADNKGVGIMAGSGDINISSYATLQVEGNGGWGLVSEGGVVTFSPFTVGTNSVSHNGSGDACYAWSALNGHPVVDSVPCVGGGILGTGGGSLVNFFNIYDTEIIGNAGPGILTSAPELILAGVNISNNQGPGASAERGAAIIANGLFVENQIVGNRGDGLVVGRDRFLLRDMTSLTVKGNLGRGIFADVADVALYGNTQSGTLISDNGGGGTHCIDWYLGSNGTPVSSNTICSTGGLVIQDGSLVASNLQVSGNAGVGIDVSRDVTLSHSQVCNNALGNLVADGAVSQDAVSESCARPRITANGADGQLLIDSGTPLTISCALASDSYEGSPADWWVYAETPYGRFSYVYPTGWQAGSIRTAEAGLTNFPAVPVLDQVALPPGRYTFHFSVDGNADWLQDSTWRDSVSVSIR